MSKKQASAAGAPFMACQGRGLIHAARFSTNHSSRPRLTKPAQQAHRFSGRSVGAHIHCARVGSCRPLWRACSVCPCRRGSHTCSCPLGSPFMAIARRGLIHDTRCSAACSHRSWRAIHVARGSHTCSCPLGSPFMAIARRGLIHAARCSAACSHRSWRAIDGKPG